MATVERSLYLSEMRTFYAQHYLKDMNYESIKNKSVRDCIHTHFALPSSHVRRVTVDLQQLKYYYLCPKTSIIATCVKATYKNTTCIIGFIYSQYDSKSKNHIENMFIATGGTMRSQDGEYRHRMHLWSKFQKTYEKNANYFDRVELYVLNKMAAGQLTFHTEFCFPMDFAHSEKLMSDMIDSTRIFVKMFVVCMFVDYDRIETKTIENHINPAYQSVIYQKDFRPVYDELLAELTRSGMDIIRCAIEKIGDPNTPASPMRVYPECGQKIIPITVFEAIKMNNINMPIWREIYITNLCSNLVLNFNSPAFSFIVNWLYIQNSHPGIFDNLAMHDKYRFSEIAKQIAAGLAAANKLNYTDGDPKRGPIDPKFVKVAKYIQNANKYIDGSLKLADLSVCLMTEYVGVTVRDMPGAFNQPHVALFFTKEGCFHKHIFEFIHGFYAMNTKVGAIHGDLHLNNVTYHSLHAKLNPARNAHVIYGIEHSYYILPHTGSVSMIIDFSRAILGDRARVTKEFGEEVAKELFKAQSSRIIQLLYHYFPTVFEKYHVPIESLLIDRFDLVFKILTAIDTYTLTSNIAAMFVVDSAFKSGQIVVPPEISKFLVRVSQLAESLIVGNLRDAIDGKIKRAVDIEWPNYVIIKTCFEKYLFQNYVAAEGLDLSEPIKTSPAAAKGIAQKVGGKGVPFEVHEYFSTDNEMKYDISDFAKWGPLLSIERQATLAKKYGMPTDEYERATEQLSIDETEKIEFLMSQYRREERDLAKIESWMLV